MNPSYSSSIWSDVCIVTQGGDECLFDLGHHPKNQGSTEALLEGRRDTMPFFRDVSDREKGSALPTRFTGRIIFGGLTPRFKNENHEGGAPLDTYVRLVLPFSCSQSRTVMECTLCQVGDTEPQNGLVIIGFVLNLYYTGKEGNARKFAQEMTDSGTVAAIRAEDGNLRYEYFVPMGVGHFSGHLQTDSELLQCSRGGSHKKRENIPYGIYGK